MSDLTQDIRRQRLAIFGAVQGVGFRPFVFRLATDLRLAGFVLNSASGALIELEGDAAVIELFRDRLMAEAPPACRMLAIEATWLAPLSSTAFEIRESHQAERKTAAILPDLATCPECLAETLRPGERRFGYAFTNCTNCGPRFSIITAIPYDRPSTTMAAFPLCPDCRREYESPEDRRFHAQPIACPICGPQLSEPISATVESLRRGEIVALKGIGGYQLLCDATSRAAVQRLRERKHREAKPFAVLFPSLASIEQHCFVANEERSLLASSAAPIVLLHRRRASGALAPEVDGFSPYTGAMLPCSPLHHLLMREMATPLVATSGNRSDEPIAIDNDEARVRLAAIADRFLAHDRPIARPVDDSVVRLGPAGAMMMRRARGYAPLPIVVSDELPSVLAVGAHLKNTVAIGVGRMVFMSQHIGDLETPEAVAAFERAIDALSRLYDFTPEAVACDLHPDYVSTRHAASLGLPVIPVQHHLAHAAACAAENGVAPPYLGIAWDGTGLGTDGAIWGSECLAVEGDTVARVSHLAPFTLPGGDKAARDCRRPAFSLLATAGLPVAHAKLSDTEAAVMEQMIARRLHSPTTTSMGRLFDAVALLAGVASANQFEGQAAMRLEAAIEPGPDDAYPVELAGNAIDWRPVIAAILDDSAAGVPAGAIARRFHNTAARWIVRVARETGFENVVLSGGVFQNAYLSERAVSGLRSAGFRVFLHQRVPPNDGGIALGQATLAARPLRWRT